MSPARTFVLLALLTLFWGLNWPIMKLALREMSPLWFRAVTMSGGLVLMFVWYRFRSVSFKLPPGQFGRVVLVAWPNVLGWHALSIFGVQELASGRAAIVGFTMPIWTVLLGVGFFRERMTWRYGLASIFAALAIFLLLRHEFAHMSGRPVGMAWMLAAAVSWALGTLLLRRVHLSLNTEALIVWMFAVAVPPLWALALWFEAPPRWEFSIPMWWALAYGAAINYGIGQIIWFTIARRLPPIASALSVMMIPVIGLGSAMWIVGETPYAEDWGAAVLIVMALATVLLRRPASR